MGDERASSGGGHGVGHRVAPAPGRRSSVVLAVAAVVALLAVVGPGVRASGAATSPAEPSEADGGSWVVSLGDSYISGEGGRWAGASDQSSSLVDALGPTAYDDDPSGTGELIPGCHRSSSAEVHIGGGLNSLSLACSGAATTTQDGALFKPGLDFYDVDGKKGQALMLQEFAATHDVAHLAISIGGNNFNFAPVIQACVEDFLASTPWSRWYCSQDSDVLANFSPANVAVQRDAIVTGLRNVREAMRTAGYADGGYSVSVQNYPAPIPYGRDFRYPEDTYERFTVGGCGLWDVDANWALNEVLRLVNGTVFDAAQAAGLERLVLLDLTGLTRGHELCNEAAALLPDGAVERWSEPGAVTVSEWINQIYAVGSITGPHELQESLHPNYWAQLALRGCLRLVYNDGDAVSGSCVQDGDGLGADGEPPVALGPITVPSMPLAAPDAFTVAYETALVLEAPGVLANDASPDAGSVLTASLVAGPDHGTVRLLSDGSLSYQPAPGFVGADTFSYRTATRDGASEEATVTITVAEPAPAAPPAGPPAVVLPRFTG